MSKLEIKTTDSRIVYQNKYGVTLREEVFERSDGYEGLYGFVEKADFALVVPFDGAHFWLVEQYRYPARRRSLEFPQGTFREGDGDPLELARCELREETGLVSGNMKHLGRFYGAPGLVAQAFNVFLATDLRRDGDPKLEPEEAGLTQAKLSRAELEATMRVGAIIDAPSITAYFLALQWLG